MPPKALNLFPIFIYYFLGVVFQDGGVAAHFFSLVMSSQIHCFWSHFLSSLLSQFIYQPPSLLSLNLGSPSFSFCHFPSTFPPHLLPFTLPSLLSVFSFFLQLHWYHPEAVSSPFASFDHHSLHHCCSLILLSLSTSPLVFLVLFLPPAKFPASNVLTGSPETHTHTHTPQKPSNVMASPCKYFSNENQA